MYYRVIDIRRMRGRWNCWMAENWRKRMRGTINSETIKHPHDPSCSCFGLPIAVSIGRPPTPPGMGPLVGMVPPAYTPGWSDQEMQPNVDVLAKFWQTMATLHRWSYRSCSGQILSMHCISGFCMHKYAKALMWRRELRHTLRCKYDWICTNCNMPPPHAEPDTFPWEST